MDAVLGMDPNGLVGHGSAMDGHELAEEEAHCDRNQTFGTGTEAMH